MVMDIWYKKCYQWKLISENEKVFIKNLNEFKVWNGEENKNEMWEKILLKLRRIKIWSVKCGKRLEEL